MNGLICLLAVLVDRVLGDPKKGHPVIWIGAVIAWSERKLNRGKHRKWKGAVAVLLAVGLTGAVVFSLVTVAKMLGFYVWFVVEVVLISLALAQKSLEKAAVVVRDALVRGDMEEARTKLGWIVGRDTDALEEPEIVRGVIETVSENTSDGVTAPLFYALLFGATGAWCYKAINTLDSMIAYRNERYEDFGFVAAKLDDLANFIPSRLTGLLLLVGTKAVFGQPLRTRFQAWRIDAKKHPSPNSGYLEAATAIQLGIRLGGYNTYGSRRSFRAYMGEPLVEMNRTHITQAIQHMYRCTLYVAFIGCLISVCI